MIRRVQGFLKINNDPDLSVKWINDTPFRMRNACRSEYLALLERICRSKWVIIDETGFHVEGKKFWLWAFRSAESDVLIIMLDSRERHVLKETMGDNFHGPVIVDGWRAYSYLTIIQRRWSHLIREVDALMNTYHGLELSDEIHSMFREQKESLKSENIDEPKSMKDLFDRRIVDLVKCYDPYRELHKPVEYIRNGAGP